MERDSFQLVKIHNPFDCKDRDIVPIVYNGQSLLELRHEHLPDLEVMIVRNGGVVPVDEWGSVCPQAGDSIAFIPAIRGGKGKNIFRMILMVAVALVAPWIAGPTMLGGALGLGTLGMKLLGGAIMLVGGMIVNALIPPPMPKMNDLSGDNIMESNAYGWLPQTTHRQGLPIPRVFGNNLLNGNVIATDIESINSKQYLNALVSLGMGRLAIINDIKLNDQPIGNYTAVSYSLRYGKISQTVPPQFTDTKIEHSVGQTVTAGQSREYTTPNNNFNAVEIVVKFPHGIWYANDGGGMSIHDIQIAVDYRIHGGGGYTNLITETVKDDRTSTIYKTYKLEDLAIGDQYDIRVQKLTADEGTRYGDDVEFHMIKEVIYDDFTYPKQALVSIRALATDQLSGRFSFSCKTTGQYIREWDGASWSIEVSNNLAWVAYNILTQPVFNDALTEVLRYDGMDASRLDYAAFKEWADFCDELVPDGDGGTEKRLTFNGQFDSEYNRWDAFLHVCRLGRAFPVWNGSSVSVVVDQVSDVVQLFSVGNIGEGSFEETWTSLDERASEIDADFINSENGFKRDVISVFHSALDNPSNRIRIPCFGLNKPSEVWRTCMYQLAQNKYLLRNIEFSADIDAIACTIGDRIQVQHDVPIWGDGGRIVSATSTTITLDKEVEWDAVDTWVVKLVLEDDTIVTRTVTAESLDADDQSVLTVSTLSPVPKQYNVYAYGKENELVKDFRVSGFQIESDLKCRIQAVEYNANVYAADGDSPVLPEPDNVDIDPIEAVTELELDEIYEFDELNGTLKRQIQVAWQKPTASFYVGARVYYRISAEASWRFAGETTEDILYINDVLPSTAYDVLVQSIAAMGVTLSFTDSPTESITTAGTEYFNNIPFPPDVTNLGLLPRRVEDSLNDTLLGLWTLNDGSGLTAIDGSGNNNHGTLEGSMTDADWVQGVSGKALDFDGVNDRVDCGNGSPLDDIGNNSDFSVSFWMKSKDAVPLDWGNLFSKTQDGDNILCIQSQTTNDVLRVYFKAGGSVKVQMLFTDITPFDTFRHHIVVVFSFTNSKVYVYMDGIISSVTSYLPSGNWSNTGNISWGAKSDGTSPYEGDLDECRIYNKALTANEVEALYLYPSGPEIFTGRDCIVAWDPIDWNILKDYEVQISGEALGLRTEHVTEPHYNYLYEKNLIDEGGPRRDLTINVLSRDVLGRYSENPATLTCSNIAPSLAGTDPDATAIFNGLRVSWSGELSDIDLQKFEIYLDKNTPPTTVKQTVGLGVDTVYFADLDAEDTYYCKIVPHDDFGVGVASNIVSEEPLKIPTSNLEVETTLQMSDSDSNDADTLAKLYNRNKTADGVTYSRDAEKYIQYLFPVDYIVDLLQIWTDVAADVYVAYSDDEGVTWNYLKAEADHTLDADGEMVVASDQTDAQTNYWTLGIGKNTAFLPNGVAGKYFRLYILESDPVANLEIFELVFKRAVVAEEVITDELSAIVANLGTITAGVIQSSNWASDQGSLIDLDAEVIKFGGNDSPKFHWNGTNLNLTGALTLSEGSGIIGGSALPSGESPATTGLFMSRDYLGFYDHVAGISGEWQAYINKDGNFHFKGDADNYIEWLGSELKIKGSLQVDNLAAISSDLGAITAGSMSAARITSGYLSVSRLEAETITANKIVTDAGFNGERLAHYGYGSVSVAQDAYATITHSLGRYAVANAWSGINMYVLIAYHTSNTFRVYNKSPGVGNITITYAYI